MYPGAYGADAVARLSEYRSSLFASALNSLALDVTAPTDWGAYNISNPILACPPHMPVSMKGMWKRSKMSPKDECTVKAVSATLGHRWQPTHASHFMHHSVETLRQRWRWWQRAVQHRQAAAALRDLLIRHVGDWLPADIASLGVCRHGYLNLLCLQAQMAIMALRATS